MLISTLLTNTRNVLQDADADYWTDTELLEYYNSGIKSIASERIEEPTTTSLPLIDDTYEYDVSGVLRYISIEDSNGIDRPLYADDGTGDDETYGVIVLDYDRLYVNNPLTGVTLTIKHISLPSDQLSTENVRIGDETALKYFILSRAYEKEQDVENFQKSQYFMQLFRLELNKLLKHSKVNYRKGTDVTKSYFY